ncbi:hypothetical protein EJ03DRAFT_349998 [Teratosphaeria nubilosa]|uniref:Uncharacterized protein n=1 Tax=Teratosphaeria nubilosa TaxID=161662 RepID=A0A6G1LDG5_9PEZI|nr:hypothetical protein EJ03DRAFT_349998 [Teratosphaeria nubilosa]
MTSTAPEIWTTEAIKNGEKVTEWFCYRTVAFLTPIVMIIFLGSLITRYNTTLNRLYLFLLPWFAVSSVLLPMLPVLHIAHYGLGPKVQGHTSGVPPALPGDCAEYPEELREDPLFRLIDTACLMIGGRAGLMVLFKEWR